MSKLSWLIRGPTKLEKIWQSIDIQCLSLSYSFWKGFENMPCFSRCSKTLPTQNWRFFVFFSFFHQVKTTKNKQSYIFLSRQISYLHFCGYVFSCTIIFDKFIIYTLAQFTFIYLNFKISLWYQKWQ